MIANDTELNFYVNFQNPYDVYDKDTAVAAGTAENTYYYNTMIPFDMLYMRFKFIKAGSDGAGYTLKV